MRTAGFSWSRFRSFGSDPLLLVDAEISSPTVRSQVRLLVDTAASLTTLEPRVVEALGYSAADAFAPASVRSAIGREHGYRLRIAEAKLLGVEAKNIEVMVSPLGFDDMDGLIGMSFLRHFNVYISNAQQLVGVEIIDPSRLIA
jgi:clan AA aspartic protease (TIGR02281 family)